MLALERFKTSNLNAQKFVSKEDCLKQLGTMNLDTLRLLAELSLKPGIEQKLKSKLPLIKAFL